MSTKKNTLSVMVSEQGKRGRILSLPQSATLRSALVAAGLDPEALRGAVTVDGQNAELSERLKANAYIAVTPKVAGGR